jgi:hypothetical protein
MTSKWFWRVFLVLLAAVVGKALADELRTPSGDRTWHGKVAGVPYDFRPPTPSRVKKEFWSPEDPYIMPHSFGVGWGINVGRIVYDVKNRRGGADGQA